MASSSSATRTWWSPQSGRELLRQRGESTKAEKRNKQNRSQEAPEFADEAMGATTLEGNIRHRHEGIGQEIVIGTRLDRLTAENDNDAPNTEVLQELNVNDEPDLLKELDLIIDATKNLEGDISELQYTIRNSLYASIASGVIDNEHINMTWNGAWTNNNTEKQNFAFSSERREWILSNNSFEENKRITTIPKHSSKSINNKYNDENALPTLLDNDGEKARKRNDHLDTGVSRRSRRNIDRDLHNAAKVNDTWKSSSIPRTGMITEKNNKTRLRCNGNDSYIDIDDVLNNM